MSRSAETSKPAANVTRQALLPVSFALCFCLYYLMQVPFVVIALIGAATIALYLVAPAWAARSQQRFDRDAVQLLSQGRAEQLMPRYSEAIGMRLFGAPAQVAERRGMVAAETGRNLEAREAYRKALEESGASPSLAVMLGYAHASFAVAHDDDAIRMYRSLLDSAGELPGVESKLAHAMIRKGKDIEGALALVGRCLERCRDDEQRWTLRLVEALGHAKLGQPELARTMLDDCPDLAACRGVREEIAQVLEPVSRPRA